MSAASTLRAVTNFLLRCSPGLTAVAVLTLALGLAFLPSDGDLGVGLAFCAMSLPLTCR